MRDLPILFIVIYFVSCALGSQYCGTFLDNSTLLVLDANSLWIESTPKSTAIPTQLDFQGLRLSLKSNGQAQITEIANGNVVWTDGFSNQVCNATLNCKLIFQTNGNLVIYYDSKPTGQPWSTYTNNMGAVAVLFRTTPPYLQIVNSSCQVLHYTTTAGSSNRTTPILGATTSVTVNDKAILASRWRAIFGVNTHVSHGWSSSMVYNLTFYLGAGAVRDSALPSAAQLPDFLLMKQAGTTLNLLITAYANKTTLANFVKNISTLANANKGLITSIEGFNEINNFGFVYNAVTNYANDYSGMFQAQKDLYSLVKADSSLKSLPVYDFTGPCWANGPNLGCSNYTGRADYGNQHNYPGHGEQPVRDFNAKNQLTASILGTYSVWTSTSQFVITEAGYHSSNFTPAGLGQGVTEEAQSVLIVNYFLAGLKSNIHQIFQYELIDEVWSGSDSAESHFGLFRHDRSPKPVARALHFLSQLLSDTSGKTGSLSYSFANLPIGADYLLFQKSSGQFVLVIWNKAPVYNYVTFSDIIQPNTHVTFKLPSTTATTRFRVYDVYSTTASDTQPLSPLSDVSVAGTTGTTFYISNYAVVITIN